MARRGRWPGAQEKSPIANQKNYKKKKDGKETFQFQQL
jgi:hypothetical protein